LLASSGASAGSMNGVTGVALAVVVWGSLLAAALDRRASGVAWWCRSGDLAAIARHAGRAPADRRAPTGVS
jgi:hypothetical protein